MTIIRIISVLLSVIILATGALVFLRNRKPITNKLYLAMAVLSGLWGMIYQSIEFFDSIVLVKLFNSLAYATGLLLMSSGVAFTYYFPVKRKARFLKPFIILVLVTFFLSFTPLVSGDVIKVSSSPLIYEYTTGTLEYLYIATMAYGICLIVRNLFRRNTSATAIQKTQSNLVASGFALSLVTGVSLSVVFPMFSDSVFLDNLAPFSLVFVSGFTAVAIVKHKLFDIRLIVARSLGYVLTLLTIAGGYSFLVFVVFAQFLGAKDLSNYQQALYVILAIVFGFSLPPLKNFFDRVSNTLFYRDAYDAAAFLDQFNRVLVGNIDLQPLLRQSSELIEQTLKAEYCLFGIKETDSTPRRIIGTKTLDFTEEDIAATMSDTPHIHKKLIVTDELEEGHAELKARLSKYNIAVLARLISRPNQKEGQGYLILGQKKSGNPYNKQDLQVLEIIVNELVIAIQNSMRFEEIQAFNVTLQEKVNEATRKLRLTNEKLKALDQTKDEFISMASHQLRTPLTSAKGYLSMVIEGDVGKLNKKQHDLLGQAFASSQRMVYLIADLLNVSRLQTGKFVIENKPTQLADVIETEIAQLEEAARAKEMTLTYKKPKNFPLLNMDETKIRQVVMNYVDNALYYTPAKGHINVSLEDKGNSIEFKVVDDGLGVPKHEQHHLFTKFFRAGNARKARPDGTGLGLFMAKKVVVAQGGAIIFESEEGKGSTFGFTFPKDKLKVTAESAKQAQEADITL